MALKHPFIYTFLFWGAVCGMTHLVALIPAHDLAMSAQAAEKHEQATTSSVSPRDYRGDGASRKGDREDVNVDIFDILMFSKGRLECGTLSSPRPCANAAGDGAGAATDHATQGREIAGNDIVQHTGDGPRRSSATASHRRRHAQGRKIEKEPKVKTWQEVKHERKAWDTE